MHTPGPWTVKDYGKSEYLDGASMQCNIHDGRYPYGFTIAYCDPEDANLIAAAPDLLAALRAASEVLVQDDCPMIYAQVQKALALAEGRST